MFLIQNIKDDSQKTIPAWDYMSVVKKIPLKLKQKGYKFKQEVRSNSNLIVINVQSIRMALNLQKTIKKITNFKIEYIICTLQLSDKLLFKITTPQLRKPRYQIKKIEEIFNASHFDVIFVSREGVFDILRYFHLQPGISELLLVNILEKLMETMLKILNFFEEQFRKQQKTFSQQETFPTFSQDGSEIINQQQLKTMKCEYNIGFLQSELIVSSQQVIKEKEIFLLKNCKVKVLLSAYLSDEMKQVRLPSLIKKCSSPNNHVQKEANILNKLRTSLKCQNIANFYLRMKMNEEEKKLIPEVYVKKYEETFGEYLKKNMMTTSTFRECCKIFIQIAEGIHYLQKIKIIHSDLKPANIMLEKSIEGGGNGNVKIIDFGSAIKLSDENFQMIENRKKYLTKTYFPENGTLEDLYHKKLDLYALGRMIQQFLQNSCQLSSQEELIPNLTLELQMLFYLQKKCMQYPKKMEINIEEVIYYIKKTLSLLEESNNYIQEFISKKL